MWWTKRCGCGPRVLAGRAGLRTPGRVPLTTSPPREGLNLQGLLPVGGAVPEARSGGRPPRANRASPQATQGLSGARSAGAIPCAQRRGYPVRAAQGQSGASIIVVAVGFALEFFADALGVLFAQMIVGFDEVGGAGGDGEVGVGAEVVGDAEDA